MIPDSALWGATCPRQGSLAPAHSKDLILSNPFFRPVQRIPGDTEGRSQMSRQLTFDSTLETLKKEAKHWLKGIRAGDVRARQRFAAAGAPTQSPGLRNVQFALAREYGFPGWAALRQALDDLALARRSHAERVEIVLRSAAWGGDRIAARRVLARWPEISTDSLYTAVVTGNLTEVERRLAADPAAATRKGGPLDWEPLLYFAYARMPGGDMHALDIATALLDRGADPNANWNDGWENAFTVLTGVIGQGEGNQPPHPQAAILAALLIARGANPYDTQALYNTSITGDDTTWLEILWTQSERYGNVDRWRTIEPPSLGGNLRRSAVDYLLGNAVSSNHLRRAEWLLAHGADPNGPHAYSKRSMRDEALVYGYDTMADLLVKYGAVARPLDGQIAFQAACMRLDRESARAVLADHPECLKEAEPMLAAARVGRADVVALLLELGMSVDVADETELRGLQAAVAGGSIEVVQLLVAHGADIDRPTKRYGGALGFASHFGRKEIARFLAPLSRDVHNLTYLGIKERLEQLFAEQPTLVNAVHFRLGVTPLFMLPDDEDEALEMAEFLLAHGADAGLRNKNGITPDEAARKRGLTDAADLMRADKA
jgi:ankyrin repeat protein